MLKVINSQFHNFNPYSWIFHVSSPWTLVNNSLLGSDSERQFGRDIYKYKVRQVYKNTTKNCNSSAPVPLLLLTHKLDANLVVTNIFIKIKCPSFSRERENGGGEEEMNTLDWNIFVPDHWLFRECRRLLSNLDWSDINTCLLTTTLNTWDIRNPSVTFSTLLATPVGPSTFTCLTSASWEGPKIRGLLMV